MAGDHLYELYNRHMERYGLGYALLEPESSYDLKPGVCGYIDDHGTWRPLLDITDKSAVEEAGCTHIQQNKLVRSRTSRYRWGPKYTDTVSYKKANVKAGASGLPAGIPVDASLLVEFQSEQDFGAVLLCTKEVEKAGYHHAGPFRQWAVNNAGKLLKQFPEVHKHGFHMVITTYSSPEVYINFWTRKSNHVILGFQAGLTPAGEIAPTAETYRAQSTSNWNHPIYGERKVVFFSGLVFKFHKLTGWFRKDAVKEIPHRGDESNIPSLVIRDPNDEENAYEVVVSSTGLLI
ncbi:hypothetical protein M434DRAFT_37076 [Hypoxylon sp. CO27-5]|nr:hypothetical protein M434DRAFT_37076 [Hypoxylon sp. CO27-5]